MPPSPDPTQTLLQFATGYIPSTALWIAADLKIADLIGSEPVPVSELARTAGVNEDALFRILRVLAMVGIFSETKSRHFVLTPAAELLQSGHPRSMRPTVLWLADPFHLNITTGLPDSIRTGQPAVIHVTGKSAFEYLEADAVEGERFHHAMTNLSGAAIGSALEVYDFSGSQTIVDIGGGHGLAICSILERYPEMNGILFDLEHVIPGAQKRIEDCGLQKRCRAVSGNFFESVPEGGGLYFMKSILHDWTDEQSTTILRNCRRALGGKSNGKLIALEFVVPSGNQPHASKIIDIEMLLMPGGRERIEQEWSSLFEAAGFRLSRIVPTQTAFSILEAVPA